jgi:hypothetical protein
MWRQAIALSKQIERERHLPRTINIGRHEAMKKTSLIPAAVLLLSMSTAALAQTSNLTFHMARKLIDRMRPTKAATG